MSRLDHRSSSLLFSLPTHWLPQASCHVRSWAFIESVRQTSHHSQKHCQKDTTRHGAGPTHSFPLILPKSNEILYFGSGMPLRGWLLSMVQFRVALKGTWDSGLLFFFTFRPWGEGTFSTTHSSPWCDVTLCFKPKVMRSIARRPVSPSESCLFTTWSSRVFVTVLES